MKMMLAFVAAVLTAVSCGSKKEASQQKMLGLYYSQTADLSGKKIVPFCSFGSGGLDTSVRDLKEKLPNAEIWCSQGSFGGHACRSRQFPEGRRTVLEGQTPEFTQVLR